MDYFFLQIKFLKGEPVEFLTVGSFVFISSSKSNPEALMAPFQYHSEYALSPKYGSYKKPPTKIFGVYCL